MQQPTESYNTSEIIAACRGLDPQTLGTLKGYELMANKATWNLNPSSVQLAEVTHPAALCCKAAIEWWNVLSAWDSGSVQAKRVLLVEKVARYLGMAEINLYRVITNKIAAKERISERVFQVYLQVHCRYLDVNYRLEKDSTIAATKRHFAEINDGIMSIYNPFLGTSFSTVPISSQRIADLLQKALEDVSYVDEQVKLDYWAYILRYLEKNFCELRTKGDVDFRPALSQLLAENSRLLKETANLPQHEIHAVLYEQEKQMSEWCEAISGQEPVAIVLPQYRAQPKRRYVPLDDLEPVTSTYSNLRYRGAKLPYGQ